MKIEWWMLDGLVGLILLGAACRGAAKGIGDTVLRMLGFVGGLVLAVMFSGKFSVFLAGTRLNKILHDHIYEMIGAEAGVDSAGSQSSAVTGVQDRGPDILSEKMPKSLAGILGDIENKAAEAVTERLTQIAVSVLSVVLIMLAVWIAVMLIRRLFKAGRKESVVIGFLDRSLGFVLGVLRGTLITCIIIAALIPLTALFAPDRVSEMIDALHKTYVAGVIYDINPIMFIIRHVLF